MLCQSFFVTADCGLSIWQLPQLEVQKALVFNILCLAPSSLATIVLSNYFGRLPPLFFFFIIAFAASIWAAAATTFDSFLAARILNGLFGNAAQAGALFWIQGALISRLRVRSLACW
jgi:hypothetical protein